MKKAILIYYLLFICATVFAQNIVPNPSFEIYSVCPSAGSPISDVTGWNSFKETPDYLNSCASTASCVSVPATCAGYQQATNGNAYIAIFCYGTNGFDTTLREYIGAQLLNPLSTGQKYYVSFKINLPKSTYCAVNNVGVLFSTIPYSSSNPAPIRNFAQVYTTSIITDTANWVTVTGSFIADSAYQYVIIGNFFDNQQTSVNVLNSTTYPCGSYYFIDDICVSADALACGITAVNESFLHNQIVVLNQNIPNPFAEQTTISYFLPDNITRAQILFFEQSGKIIKTIDLTEKGKGQLNVFANDLSSGIYTYTLVVDGKIVETKKMVKAK